MREPIPPRLPKWPFLAGDALLLGSAYFIYARSELPLGQWQLAWAVFCVAAGAALGVAPFLLEYRALVRIAEAAALTTVMAQVQKLEALAGEIRTATGQWETVQEQADKTAAAALGIAERMTAEVQSFNEFMQRVNDTEKANLRLEVEKLRRGEGEWLNILVRVLDHVYALHQAALRSGQPNLIEQLTHFQEACRDAARRVGLAPFSAEPDESFDAGRHQWSEGDGKPPDGAVVEETLASGYTFQGRMIRAAVVRLRQGGRPAPADSANSGQQPSQAALASAEPKPPAAGS